MVSTFNHNNCTNGSTNCVYTGFRCCTLYLFDFLKIMLNSRTKQISKAIGINIIIIGILLIAPAIFFRLYLKLKPTLFRLQNQATDPRAYYPTYSDKDFSVELLNESSKLLSDYRSFLGWRRQKVDFKHTKISGPYNARRSSGESLISSVWFFGGSTMWGTGVSDNQTIPSHFNSLTKESVYNFGEIGWNSRQSLNQLINAIGDNNEPSIVVFYDGVNDVVHQCRSEYTKMPTHSYEGKIQVSLKSRPISKNFTEFLLSPYAALANKLNNSNTSSKQFNCDTNELKARSVAQHLVNNWRTAYSLSQSKNFKFYGILQPTLFSTETNSEYLASGEVKRHPELKRQYDAVYPLIVEEISKQCESDKNICTSMIDGTGWLNGNDNIFIDFCHINSDGNKEIARRIALLNKFHSKSPTALIKQ